MPKDGEGDVTTKMGKFANIKVEYPVHEYPDELHELEDGRALRNIDPNAHCQKTAAHR